jgi:hypothetical protein
VLNPERKGRQEDRNSWQDNIKMKYYINKVEWRGSGYGPADGFFEYDNDHVVFMKFWKLLK